MKRLLISMACLVLITMNVCAQSFSEKDSGRSIRLAPMTGFRVVLPGNPTTGYTWEMLSVPDSAVVQLIEEPSYKLNSNLIGSGGLFCYPFNAVEQGATDVVLVYHRAWEKDVPPLKTFQLHVEVGDFL